MANMKGVQNDEVSEICLVFDVIYRNAVRKRTGCRNNRRCRDQQFDYNEFSNN
jgi:hypothetical protein